MDINMIKGKISEFAFPASIRNHLALPDNGDVVITLLPNRNVEIKPANEDSSTLLYRLIHLERLNEDLKRKVAFYEDEYDKDSERFINSICLGITDAHSALVASHNYSGEWFKELGNSFQRKRYFCIRLIDAVSQFNPTYVPDLWRNVVEGVPAAMRAIDV